MRVEEGVGRGGRVVTPAIPFLDLPLFYMEIVLHSKHICVRDTVILDVCTFAGLLCTSVIPRVRHSVKPEMASTSPLKSGAFESQGRFNFPKT